METGVLLLFISALLTKITAAPSGDLTSRNEGLGDTLHRNDQTAISGISNQDQNSLSSRNFNNQFSRVESPSNVLGLQSHEASKGHVFQPNQKKSHKSKNAINLSNRQSAPEIIIQSKKGQNGAYLQHSNNGNTIINKVRLSNFISPSSKERNTPHQNTKNSFGNTQLFVVPVRDDSKVIEAYVGLSRPSSTGKNIDGREDATGHNIVAKYSYPGERDIVLQKQVDRTRRQQDNAHFVFNSNGGTSQNPESLNLIDHSSSDLFLSNFHNNNFGSLKFPLSSPEDIHTDSGSLSNFGIPLLSNDAISNPVSSSISTLATTLQSSPPINPDSQNLLSSTDSLHKLLSFLPEENNQDSFILSENNSLSGKKGTISVGIPLPDIDHNDNTFIISRGGFPISHVATGSSVGVPLPDINSDNSGTIQSFGVPLPEINTNSNILLASAGSRSNVQQSPETGTSFGIPLTAINSGVNTFISSGNTRSEFSNAGASFGIPLPGVESGSNTFISSGDSRNRASNAAASFGIPLPGINSDTNVPFSSGGSLSDVHLDNRVFGSNAGFGIPLPGINSDSNTLTASDNSIQGTHLDSKSEASSAGQSFGIPLPGINPDDNFNTFQNSLKVVSEDRPVHSVTLKDNSFSNLQPVRVVLDSSHEKSDSTSEVFSDIFEDSSIDINNAVSDTLGGLTIGELLRGINGQNGVMVLPESALEGIDKDTSNLLASLGNLNLHGKSLEETEKAVNDLLENSNTDRTTTASPPETTTRRRAGRRTTTTTKAPDTFRVALSDLLYAKGQWFGTLLGGLIDFGRIAMDAFQKNIGTINFGSIGPSSSYGAPKLTSTYGAPAATKSNAISTSSNSYRAPQVAASYGAPSTTKSSFVSTTSSSYNPPKAISSYSVPDATTTRYVSSISSS